MNAITRSLFPALLCGSIALIVSAQLRPDTGLTMPDWHPRREAAMNVILAEVTRGNLRHTVEAAGKVEAEVEVKISAEVSARIAELPVREGDRVGSQQLLVRLDRAAFEADVRSAEAKVQRLKESIVLGKAEVEKARRDYERNRQLYTSRALDRATLQDSATTYEKERARLNITRQELVEAESVLAKAREDLRKTTIFSPLTGIVSQRPAKQGEVVLVGTMNNPGTVLMTVSDPNSLVVRARIDESKVSLVRPGQKAVVHLPGEDRVELTGTVKHISPKGSKSAAPAGIAVGTPRETDVTAFETVIQLDAPPPQVRMEMTVNVEILVNERRGVLAIPAQAVLHRRLRDLPRSLRQEVEKEPASAADLGDPSRRYHQVVFVESEGVARCRLVKTGVADRGRVEVVGGLSQGERVIAGPYRSFDRLKDGRPVAELADADESGGGL
jgi:HlyD family secretion protein